MGLFLGGVMKFLIPLLLMLGLSTAAFADRIVLVDGSGNELGTVGNPIIVEGV